MWPCYEVHITVHGTSCFCTLSASAISCIEPSLHGLDFFLEFCLWRLVSCLYNCRMYLQNLHKTLNQYLLSLVVVFNLYMVGFAVLVHVCDVTVHVCKTNVQIILCLETLFLHSKQFGTR